MHMHTEFTEETKYHIMRNKEESSKFDVVCVDFMNEKVNVIFTGLEFEDAVGAIYKLDPSCSVEQVLDDVEDEGWDG